MALVSRSYRWSSYRATAGFEAPPAWLTTSAILSRFGDERREAQAGFREYVDAKIGDGRSIWMRS